MITYKYKLYRTHRTKYLDEMLVEACFVWNHALALQKRYYRLYKKYIPLYRMFKHQSKRFKNKTLIASTVRDILRKLDNGYQLFFKKENKRLPKFKSYKNVFSVAFCKNTPFGVDNCKIKDNYVILNRINKKFRFHKSREYEGTIKKIVFKHNALGEYFVLFVTDATLEKYGKTRKGASVGIDFGLKTYLTLSDGIIYSNPLFMRKELNVLKRMDRSISKAKTNGNNRKQKLRAYEKKWQSIRYKRDDYQWKLAHELCRKYDQIFIEDLNLKGMKISRNSNRKLLDQSHAEFIIKLTYIATKYDVIVHKIDRYYPSSKTCTCGYVNKDLKLTDRVWTCPHCGATHDRDQLAANNILRRGIYELESNSKTQKHSADGQLCYYPTIS